MKGLATRCRATMVAAATMLASFAFVDARAQSPLDEARALKAKASELYQAGKAQEAIPLAKSALEMREKWLPMGHADIAESLNNLAYLYKALGGTAGRPPTKTEPDYPLSSATIPPHESPKS